MYIRLLFCTLLLYFGGLYFGLAQSLDRSTTLDTLYANDQKNVALFFPEPIERAITGSTDFIFTYDKKKPQHFGLLQAKPGPESNLLVIDADGGVFSYILRYSNRVNQLNYFIDSSQQVGKLPAQGMDSLAVETTKQKPVDSAYYTRFSSYLLGSAQKIGRVQKRKNRIILKVHNIVFDKNELYFVVHIINKSSLPYDLGFLELTLETRKKGKRKSLQHLKQAPVYTYKSPKRIDGASSAQMVYVVPKFSISKDHRAVLKLGELDGQRTVHLNIPRRLINNPN